MEKLTWKTFHDVFSDRVWLGATISREYSQLQRNLSVNQPWRVQGLVNRLQPSACISIGWGSSAATVGNCAASGAPVNLCPARV
jgi:hypothetical protein